MPYPQDRPRRLRKTETLRGRMRETHLDVQGLVYPFTLPTGMLPPIGDDWMKRPLFLEKLLSMKRAGADFILTYLAKDVARWLSS